MSEKLPTVTRFRRPKIDGLEASGKGPASTEKGGGPRYASGPRAHHSLTRRCLAELRKSPKGRRNKYVQRSPKEGIEIQNIRNTSIIPKPPITYCLLSSRTNLSIRACVVYTTLV